MIYKVGLVICTISVILNLIFMICGQDVGIVAWTSSVGLCLLGYSKWND